MAQETPIHRLPPVAPSDEPVALGPGAVDLWCFFYETVSDPDLLRAYDALLTTDERARHLRFHFEPDRLLYLATRALARTVLSRYADVPPAEWRFAEGERGKPTIAAPTPRTPIHFNLTNTRGLVVCAVSHAHAKTGVDAEYMDRRVDTLEIAEAQFSQFENGALRSLPSALQRDRFFRYWTLKESYIKARGLGLAVPLEQFSFLLDDGPTVRIAFDERLADDPELWRFALLTTSQRHLIAVGVDTGGVPLSLRAINYVPLRGPAPFDSRFA